MDEGLARGKRCGVYEAGYASFFAQIAVVLAAWRIARAQRITLTEALTHDIEWNGEQQ